MKSLLLLIMLVFFGCSVGGDGNDVKVSLSSAPSNLDPFFSTDSNSQNINRLLHITLTDFDESMNFSCKLCTSYQEKVKGGKHHIRFKLKKDVTFWDGTPVQASDVKKSWQYFTEEENLKSIFRFAFKKISDVVVRGPYDVELVYDQFSLENLSNLALLKILKLKDVVVDGKITKKPGLDNIIGAGPYKLGKVEPLQVVLEPLDPKKNLRLTYKVVKDETTLALKLINGEVDLSLANMSPRKFEWLKEKAGDKLQYWERASTNYIYMGINHKRDYLKNKNIRKALSLLIPRSEIVNDKLKKTVVLAKGMFSKAFKDMYDEGGEVDLYNPKLAQEILRKSGYKLNGDGFFAKAGKVLELDWKASTNKAALEIVETIKSYFERAGVKVKLVTQEWGTFMRSVKNAQFDVFINSWIGFTGPDMLRYVFHTESFPPKGANRGYYSNKKFDEVVDLATSETNKVKRDRLYKKAMKLAFSDYAYISLWHPNIIWIGKKCIEGIGLFPNGSFYPLLEMKNNCR
jgi:peptide/nickel transport system substrate-binding protein